MKRSQINKAINFARKTLTENCYYLPKIAYYDKNDWVANRQEQKIAIQNGMGWDVTDYGQGRFEEFGLCVFTLRNGNMDKSKSYIPYSEKVLVMLPGQRLPLHMHITKVEDIINRGLGTLSIQVYNSIDENTVDYYSDVEIFCDAVKRKVKAGEIIDFNPGESITLTPGIFHKFWAKKESGVLICGEISSVNDDNTDNRHVENITRFVEIDEDEEPAGLLKNEYAKHLAST